MPDSAWIETFTGRRFHLLHPIPDEICIEDIAHALANQCRFTGHTKDFYSVGEHSCHVAWQSGADYALWGLLHDASEAYISDLNRPLKHCTTLGAEYVKIEQPIMDAICAKFNLTQPMPQAVKDADNALLHVERRKLLPDIDWDADSERSWDTRVFLAPDMPIIIQCWTPSEAERNFLTLFEHLNKVR